MQTTNFWLNRWKENFKLWDCKQMTLSISTESPVQVIKQMLLLLFACKRIHLSVTVLWTRPYKWQRPWRRNKNLAASSLRKMPIYLQLRSHLLCSTCLYVALCYHIVKFYWNAQFADKCKKWCLSSCILWPLP